MDVESFRSIFGLPPGLFNTIHNGPDPGYCTGTAGLCTLIDQVENALDVEWAGAVAKGATINLVVTQQTSTNDAVYESANYVITNKIAPILSISYGLCELYLGTSGNASYNSLWQTAAAEGIAVFVASGDAGSPACDQGQSSTTPYSAQFGLSVNGLASTPFNTAVGGTDFTWCNPTASSLCTSGSPYWTSTNDAATGANVQGYISEVPWNDTCTTPAGITYIKSAATVTGLGTVIDAESACNFIRNNYVTIYSRYGVNLSFFLNVEGAGGGMGSCTTSDGSRVPSCSGGYATPSWQKDVTGIAFDGKRGLPDVSFFAGAGRWNSAYLICVSDAGTCLTTTSPLNRPSGAEVGGTSVGTPAMAGVMALINQKAGATQGNPNTGLYQLAAKQNYSNRGSEAASASNGCYFNDVLRGTNAMACTAGSPHCVVSVSGDAIGVVSGYGAGTGYDMVTGLGTLNVANVVPGLPPASLRRRSR